MSHPKSDSTGAMLNDWRGHAELCPQNGMPDSIEAAPIPQYIPYPQPYPVWRYLPYQPSPQWIGNSGTWGGTVNPYTGGNTTQIGNVHSSFSLTAGGGMNTQAMDTVSMFRG